MDDDHDFDYHDAIGVACAIGITALFILLFLGVIE